MDRAESLRSRISTLEDENRWLKHKVTLLYGVLRKELTRRKQKKVSENQRYQLAKLIANGHCCGSDVKHLHSSQH